MVSRPSQSSDVIEPPPNKQQPYNNKTILIFQTQSNTAVQFLQITSDASRIWVVISYAYYIIKYMY